MENKVSREDARAALAQAEHISHTHDTRRTVVAWAAGAVFGIFAGTVVWGASWTWIIALLMIFVAPLVLIWTEKYNSVRMNPRQDPLNTQHSKNWWVYMLPMLASITLNMWPSQSLPWAIGAGVFITVLFGICFGKDWSK